MNRILVVVDMQNDFVDAALGTAEAVAILPAVCGTIADPYYTRVIATFDTHGENYLDTLEGKKLPVVHCVRGTDGWQLNPAVRGALEARGYEAVEKPTFGSLALAQQLQAAYAADPDTEVTLCGLCTDICVISNALLLRAHCPDMTIRVVRAACAGVSPATHEAALAAMGCCQIDVI